jgi:hypothetical protein
MIGRQHGVDREQSIDTADGLSDEPTESRANPNRSRLRTCPLFSPPAQSPRGSWRSSHPGQPGSQRRRRCSLKLWILGRPMSRAFVASIATGRAPSCSLSGSRTQVRRYVSCSRRRIQRSHEPLRRGSRASLTARPARSSCSRRDRCDTLMTRSRPCCATKSRTS